MIESREKHMANAKLILMQLIISGAVTCSCFAQFQISPEGRISYLLDPESEWDRFEFLKKDQQIQESLGCDSRVVEAVNSLYEGVKNDVRDFMLNASKSKVSTSLVNEYIESRKSTAVGFMTELLTPSQRQRLKELAFRMEIVHMGFEWALTKGRFGQSVGIHEEQKSGLSRRIQKLETEAEEKIRKIKHQLELDVLAELTLEQRKKAAQRIGAPTTYRAMTQEDVALRQALDIASKKKAAIDKD